MRVLLMQLDGAMPNIALMRIAAHHKVAGDSVTFRRTFGRSHVQRHIGDDFQAVYASAIFQRTAPVIAAVKREWPLAELGGTGANLRPLEQIGITSLDQDYSIYPGYENSIGFTQRGCRLKCEFCVVPQKEGKVRTERTIGEIWRGDPWPRRLILLDNDFFGQSSWRQHIADIRDGNFKVSFNQGINARCLTDEAAEAIASVKYYDDDFTTRRIYTAWDNRGDEERLFKGLRALVRYGVKPDQIMVYMLVGYWPGETAADREYRRMRLREFGCRPYPMPYVRNSELIGFQRWVIGSYDKPGIRNHVPWDEWFKANCRPENVRERREEPLFPVLN